MATLSKVMSSGRRQGRGDCLFLRGRAIDVDINPFYVVTHNCIRSRTTVVSTIVSCYKIVVMPVT